MTLMVVPENGTALDVLAQRYRAATEKMASGTEKMANGREQWIEGTLELAAVVRDARTELPDHRAFSRWLELHNLKKISPQDRSALNQFADDLVYARRLLEQSNSISWQQIWRTRPNRTPSQSRKGPISYTSGASKRKRRAARVPDVMRDDLPPRPAVNLKGPTREEIDPDFKGTHLEWVTKYGHVNLQTKKEIEHTRNHEALSAWLGAMSEFARAGQAAVAALSTVDPATLREWTTKPGKAAKLRTWCESVRAACEKLLAAGS